MTVASVRIVADINDSLTGSWYFGNRAVLSLSESHLELRQPMGSVVSERRLLFNNL